MPKQVNGVLGLIDIDDLGFTLMHEHFLVADWSLRHAFSDWVVREEILDIAVRLSLKAKKAGVKTIVDMTPINLGRDVELIKEIAEKSQIQVIASTGLYYTEDPWLIDKDINVLINLFTRDITEGMEGTNIKAGMLKCATDILGITDVNRKLLRATALAGKATNTQIYTHTIAATRSGLMQQDIFENEGMNLEKVIIGHCGDTDDLDYLEAILSRGSYIGLDRFGSDFIYPFENRINTLLELCKRGWTEKIIISQDMPCYYDWGQNEWQKMKKIDINALPVDFCYISNNVLPVLLERGITREQIRIITVDNPRRFLGQ